MEDYNEMHNIDTSGEEFDDLQLVAIFWSHYSNINPIVYSSNPYICPPDKEEV